MRPEIPDRHLTTLAPQTLYLPCNALPFLQPQIVRDTPPMLALNEFETCDFRGIGSSGPAQQYAAVFHIVIAPGIEQSRIQFVHRVHG